MLYCTMYSVKQYQQMVSPNHRHDIGARNRHRRCSCLSGLKQGSRTELLSVPSLDILATSINSPNRLPLMLSLRSLSFLAVRCRRNRACLNLATPILSNCKPALPRTTPFHRRISTAPVPSEEYIGQSGRSYSIERVLQEETFPHPRRVYLAT